MMRQSRGTANLLQAQRDFFGAHGFERVDKSGTGFHGPWGSHTGSRAAGIRRGVAPRRRRRRLAALVVGPRQLLDGAAGLSRRAQVDERAEQVEPELRRRASPRRQ